MNEELKKCWHTEYGFINPEGNITTRGFHVASLRWIWSRIFSSPYCLGKDLPQNHIISRNEALNLYKQYEHIPSLTWLGHSTFVFRIGTIEIITDPLIFGNPGPRWIRGLVRLPSPLDARDISPNVLLLSHEHRDHIHQPSLESLYHRNDIQPIVPLGIGKKIQRYGFKKAQEMDWFDEYLLSGNIQITLVPAVHYSNFTNTTLWAGFIISYRDIQNTWRKIYFAGDTDYGPFMKRDIAPYGPFDLAIVGVGGFSLPFTSRADIVHTNPEEAIQTALDIQAKKIIGMHWGTLKLADEDPKELLMRMERHAHSIGYSGSVKMMHIGETLPL